ncbi:MAG: AAA family ATPase [Candidatus Hadarchaeales archaeon]
MNIFLLGRPGSGKTTIFKMLREELASSGVDAEIVKINDFPILLKIFEEDKEFKRHKPTPGGFKVTDESVWDDMAKELAKTVEKLQEPGRLVFVEFARKSYERALKNFDKKILEKSLAIYVKVPFDICLKRNLKRSGMETEIHLVPEEEMRKTYEEDDHDKISEFLPLIIVENVGDFEDLKKKTKEIVQKILEYWRKHETH